MMGINATFFNDYSILRIIFLVFSIIFFVGVYPNAQSTLWEESFETCGNSTNCGDSRYTSTNDFHEGVAGADDDYFGRVHGGTLEYYLTDTGSGFFIDLISPQAGVGYSGYHGNFYYAAEDLDDFGGAIGSPDGLDVKEIVVSDINIAGATNIFFSGLFARGETDLCSQSTYDSDDYIKVFYEVDNNGEVEALCFYPDIECNIPGDVTNEPLHHDPNCDGDGGEGTILTSTFQSFGFNIPDGIFLDLRISIHMDAGSEEVAIDHLTVKGDCPVNYAGGNALTGIINGVANYVTDGAIESTQTIGATGVVNYDSGVEIYLNPNFETILGAIFNAFIDGCGGAMLKERKGRIDH